MAGYSRWAVATAIVALAAMMPYMNTLNGEMCYDDKVAVGGNPDVALPDVTMWDIFTHDFWGNDILRTRKGGWTHDSWRPLVTLSFRANHKMGQLRTMPYHITNLIIHAICCVIAYAGYFSLFKATNGRYPHFQGFVSALLFAMHPLHSETVANITGRADPMAAWFCLSALFVYTRGRQAIESRPSFLSHLGQGVIAFVLVVLGLMCKETSLVMPALLVVADVAIRLQYLPDEVQRRLAGPSPPHPVRALLMGLMGNLPWVRSCSTVASGAGLYFVRIVHFSRGYDLKDFANEMHNPLAYIKGMWTRLRAVGFVQSWALTSTFFPIWLSHEHAGHSPVTDITDPRNLCTLLFVAVFIGAVCWAARAILVASLSTVNAAEPLPSHEQPDEKQTREPTERQVVIGLACRLLMCIMWLVVSYAPASHAFLFVAFVIAERTLFLPSWAACVIMADVIAVVAGQWKGKGGREPTEWKMQGVERVDDAFAPDGTREGSDTDSARPTTTQSIGNSGFMLQLQHLTIRNLLSLALLSFMCVYYGIRTWTRGYDWLNEEALLESNLSIYPEERNGASMYGMGAIRLYAEKWDEAEILLKKAAAQTSLAEPHILLSQLEWRGRRNASAAIRHLETIEFSSSPRKEVMQNLGLLLISEGRAPDGDEQARLRVERNILIGHAGHGYPNNHPHIGVLAMNAACMRLISEPRRFGDPALALSLAEQSAAIKHGSRFNALRNLASIHAVAGRRVEAEKIMDEADNVLTDTWLSHVKDDLPEPSMVTAARAVHSQFQALRLALRVHGADLHRWSLEEARAGAVAEERMQQLGLECVTELLFW